MAFSVLLSVYQHEKAEYLRQSFDSIFNQTLLPDEVVLVEDGPLTETLYEEIQRQKELHPELCSVKMETNQGLGAAMNLGLQHCHHDIVARMDTDDICLPERFERQYRFLEAHPEVDVVGTWISEFIGSPDNIVSIRNLPEEQADILQFAKTRNPINHPTAMFRREAVLQSGNYQTFPLFEDYYLWARMLNQGYRFHNIAEPLLYFRRSPQMMNRRGGLTYAIKEILFQQALRNMGFISTPRMLKNIVMRYGLRIVPNGVRSWVYSRFLRLRTIRG